MKNSAKEDCGSIDVDTHDFGIAVGTLVMNGEGCHVVHAIEKNDSSGKLFACVWLEIDKTVTKDPLATALNG